MMWVVAAVTVVAGFFALCSFSLRSFSRARLEDVFSSGAAGRRRLDFLDRQLPAMQRTMSLCVAMAYLVLLGSVDRVLGGDGGRTWGQSVQALLISGALISIFGVAIPHAWSTYAPESILRTTFPILLLFRYALYPVTAIMTAFDVPIRRLTGTVEADEEERNEEVKQEILQAAAEGHAEGAVDAEEVEMLESVLEFSNTDAAEIMTPRTDMFALPAELGWDTVVRKIHEAGHTRVPVYRNNLDNIIGMVYAKDLLRYVGKEHPESIERVVRKCFFVPETKPLDDLLREFKTRKVHVAIVLDEYGGTAGLVTIEDVIEEIVGDISDEYDVEESSRVRRINETTAEVEGRLRIDELNDLLDLELSEDEDYDTVAGYAAMRLGYIPVKGETFSADQADFTILEADERKITRLRVERIDNAGSDH